MSLGLATRKQGGMLGAYERETCCLPERIVIYILHTLRIGPFYQRNVAIGYFTLHLIWSGA